MSSATVTRADGDGRSVAATGTGSSAPTQGPVLAGSSGPAQPRLSGNGGVAEATAVSGLAKADATRPSTFKAGSPPRPVVGAQKIITKILAIQSQTSAVGVAAVPPRLALTAPAAGTGHDGGAGATVAPAAAAGSGGAGAGAGAGGGAPLTAVAEGAVVDGATTTQDEEEALWRDAMAARRGTVISFEFFPAKVRARSAVRGNCGGRCFAVGRFALWKLMRAHDCGCGTPDGAGREQPIATHPRDVHAAEADVRDAHMAFRIHSTLRAAPPLPTPRPPHARLLCTYASHCRPCLCGAGRVPVVATGLPRAARHWGGCAPPLDLPPACGGPEADPAPCARSWLA